MTTLPYGREILVLLLPILKSKGDEYDSVTVICETTNPEPHV